MLVLVGACSSLPPSSPVPDALGDRVRVYGSEVSKLRGLPQLREVPAGIQSEAELRSSMQTLMRAEWDEEEQTLEEAYKLFGLIPGKLDLLQYLVDLYTGQVAGYYDPKSGRFFIRDLPPGAPAEADPATESSERSTGAAQQFVISHEFTHALQDQHFDLAAMDERYARQADRATAIAGLTEGDAMLAAIDHLAWRTGLPVSAVSPLGRAATVVVGRTATSTVGSGDSPEAQQLRDAPAVISTNLTFPYVEGMNFASAIRSEFGQAALDSAFRDPPDSTEQILYPERYIDRRDRPAEIQLIAPPLGFTASLDQTLGMLDLRVLLETYIGSTRAAEGWDGDRFAIWRSDPSASDGGEPLPPLLVWVSAWDSEREAARFSRTYARVLEAKRGDDHFAITRIGDVVAVVEGAPADQVQPYASELLRSSVTRDPNERPRPSLLERALRWPAAFERLDRVNQAKLLGGSVLSLRYHDAGYRFSLASGILLGSERTPDRSSHSLALGLIWCSQDRLHEYFAATVPVLFSYQRRGVEGDLRRELQLGQTVLLPSLLRWQASTAETRWSLLGLIAGRIGPSVPRGERVRLLFGYIPLPI